MKSRFWIPAALLAAPMLFVIARQADSQSTAGGGKNAPPTKVNQAAVQPDVTNIFMEIELLKVIDDLELTPAQLDYLAANAKETSEKLRPRKAPKMSAEYLKTLAALHTAMKNNDSDLATDLQDKLDELADKEEVIFDDKVNATEAALKKTFDFLRMLRVTQVMSYLQAVDILDPIELIEEALQDSQELKGKDWAESRDPTAKAVGHILAGNNIAKGEEYRKKVLSLLDKAHKLKPAEYGAAQKSLLAEAHEIMGKMTPFEMIRNQVAANLAEFLSNPRLSAAVAIRKANPPKNN